MRKFPPRLAVRNVFPLFALASLILCLAVGAIAQFQDQSDWHQWTAKYVHKVLTNSPWVSTCCRDWSGAPASSDGVGDATATLGYSASIVSSQMVRQALVRRLRLDRRYQTLDHLHRAEVDQRIAACLSERFDKYIVVSFGLNFAPDPKFGSVNPNGFHLLTPDGRKIVGQVVNDSIALKCSALPSDLYQYSIVRPVSDLGLYGPHDELAFPRIVDGKPTIGPNDKRIRIDLDLDFYKKSWPGHSVAEIDFNIAKLTYQGKPDF
jgi:hypothetical protein